MWIGIVWWTSERFACFMCSVNVIRYSCFDSMCFRASEWIQNTIYGKIEIVYISKCELIPSSVVFETNRIGNSRMQMPEKKNNTRIKIFCLFFNHFNFKLGWKKLKNRFASFWIRRGFDRVIHWWHGDAPVHPISLFVFAVQSDGTRTPSILHIHLQIYCTRHFYSFFFSRYRKYSNHIIIIIKRKCVRIAKKWKKKRRFTIK